MKAAMLMLMGLGTPESQEFVKIPASRYEFDPLIPVLRDFGRDFALKKAMKAHDIPHDIFTLFSVNHISKHFTARCAFYKFDISLESPKGVLINILFTVRYKFKSKKPEMMTYTYKVDAKICSKDNEDINCLEPGYTAVPVSEYNTLLVMNLADMGKDYIVRKAINQDRLPEGIYDTMKLTDVTKKMEKDGLNYKIMMDIKSISGDYLLQGAFKVSYQPMLGKKTITAYDYNVLVA